MPASTHPNPSSPYTHRLDGLCEGTLPKKTGTDAINLLRSIYNWLIAELLFGHKTLYPHTCKPSVSRTKISWLGLDKELGHLVRYKNSVTAFRRRLMFGYFYTKKSTKVQEMTCDACWFPAWKSCQCISLHSYAHESIIRTLAMFFSQWPLTVLQMNNSPAAHKAFD